MDFLKLFARLSMKKKQSKNYYTVNQVVKLIKKGYKITLTKGASR